MTDHLEQSTSHSINFGKKKIPFTLAYKPKKRLSITVLPSQEVQVLAPKGQALDKILALVEKRAGWISQKRDYFEQFQPLPCDRQYVSGETHLYLGRQYRLKVRKSDKAELSSLSARTKLIPCGYKNQVKLIGQFFQITVQDPSDQKSVQQVLDAWYEDRAKANFGRKIELYAVKHPGLNISPNNVTIRRMTKRWGSCTKAGNIRLNLDLIKTPIQCIEYVIAHELCHLKVHDHSPAFYRLLKRLMPDWEKRKARLDSFIL